jgi:hypothetical protein
VRFDGRGLDYELVCDLGVAQAAGEQANDVLLARGQLLKDGRVIARVGELLEQSARACWCEQSVAVVDRVDRGDQLVRWCCLERR